MLQLLKYLGAWQAFKQRMWGFPAWGRALILVAALPGIVLGLLSILAFLVSLAALLLLTVPVYRIVSLLGGVRRSNAPSANDDPEVQPTQTLSPPPGVGVVVEPGQPVTVEIPAPEEILNPRPARRQIDVRIVE